MSTRCVPTATPLSQTRDKLFNVSAIYIIGDIHGHYAQLVQLLYRAHLIDAGRNWTGGEATLCFLGDFFDRGPDGISCINLVMRLQEQADAAGGRVAALLGNHEPLLLSVHRFVQAKPAASSRELGAVFLAIWRRNGGRQSDLERLTPQHVEWLTGLPAMLHMDGRLLIHADSLMYAEYGQSVDAVNRAIATVLQDDDAVAWDTLLQRFMSRCAFVDDVPVRPDHAIDPARSEAVARVRAFLQRFGGSQLIHGHTPIQYMIQQPRASVTAPLIYADGLCVDLDSGLYLGGTGFVYKLPPLE